MQKIRNRKKLRKHTKIRVQKNIMLLFILALILSPFGGIGGHVYADEDGSEEPGQEQVNPADKSNLDAKLKDIDEENLDEADYTEASWQTLQNTMTTVQSVTSDDDATQDEVDDSLATLTKDYKGLKEVEEPTDEATAEDSSEEDGGAETSEQDDATNDEEESDTDETDSEDEASKSDEKAPSNTTEEPEENTEPKQPLTGSGDFDWSDNGDGTVTVTGYTGSDKDIKIPNKLDGKSVTKIGDGAFAINSLSSVVIPEGVTEIGEMAFIEGLLTSVVIPESVTEIGDGAFAHNFLTSIAISENVTKIGRTAFLFNNLKGTVVIPKSVTEIGGGAFGDNPLVNDAMIYNPEVEIGGDPFADLHGNPSDTIIHGYLSSTAEEFANEFDYTFKPFDENDKCSEDSTDMHITINLDEETDVCGSQEIEIADTVNQIVMPADLPANSTLTITDVGESDIVTKAKGLPRAGSVLKFILKTPEGTEYTENFTLKMSYANGISSHDIYYYNEETKQWDGQGAEYDYDNFTLNVELSHLSTYGVFGKDGEEEKEEKEEDESSEGDDSNIKEESSNPSNGTDNKCSEDSTDMHITINLDEETDVCASQEIEIADTVNQIVMPADLPANSTLTITDVGESDIVTKAKGLHRAGSVLKFILKTPEGTEYTENFTLKMSYANGVSSDDIYYYNEETKQWDGQGAEYDYDDFTLNVELSHLSTYGVFGKDEEEDESSKKEVIKEEEDDDSNEVVVSVEDDKEGSFLPSTATGIFNWILIGVGILIIGLTIFIINRRKSSKQG